MKKKYPELKIAVVTDSMIGFGGSDRLLLSLLKIFPNAQIFTSIYDKKVYSKYNLNVKTTFLQHFKIFKRHLNFLTPLAFETLNLSGYDVVISLSAGSAKGIITRLNQSYICIMLTPPRHQWDRELNARASHLRLLYGLISKFISHYLRIWDLTAICRVPHIISISKYIQEKTYSIYQRTSKVIYPGISDYWFEKPTNTEIEKVKLKYHLPNNFFLCAGRFFDHKRIDWGISAIKNTKYNLVVAGTGPDLPFLKKISKGLNNIYFVLKPTDEELKVLYYLSTAFIHPQLEDFGYMAIEAQALGTPVLAYNEGGALETVVEGVTGQLFSSPQELSSLVLKRKWIRYNTKDIINNAKRFSEKTFLRKIFKEVNSIYEKEKY